MSTETKQLMMDLLLAGAEGISIKTLTKYRQTFEAEFVRLEMAMLMQWMPDRTGKPVAVSLTWKGEEAAALLREFAIKETRKFSYS